MVAHLDVIIFDLIIYKINYLYEILQKQRKEILSHCNLYCEQEYIFENKFTQNKTLKPVEFV